MDKDDELWYEHQFDMFGTDGWKDFVNHVNEMLDSCNSLTGLKTLEDLYEAKGQLSIMEWIVSWQKACEENFKRLSANDDSENF